MSSLFPRLLADFSTLPWIAIICIIGGFLVAITALVAGIWFAQRRQQMWHETARIALEKGQPLPPQLSEEKDESPSRGNDIRYGLILIGVGAGLYLFLSGIGGRLGYVGAIPGFIGVALLLYGILNAIFAKKTPPQS